MRLHSLNEMLEFIKQYLVNGWVLVTGGECVDRLLESLPGEEEIASALVVYSCGYARLLVMLRKETLRRTIGDKITPSSLEKLVTLDLYVEKSECYGRLIGPGDPSERQAFIEDLARSIAEYLVRDEVERCTDLSVM